VGDDAADLARRYTTGATRVHGLSRRASRGRGFSDEACYHAYHVLDAYIVGSSLWLAGHSLTAAGEAVVREKVAQEFTIEDFPRLVKHHRQHLTDGSHREVSAFELGLDVMLEGLKEMLMAEQSTRGNQPRT
jgi:tetracycline repressor-like protein